MPRTLAVRHRQHTPTVQRLARAQVSHTQAPPGTIHIPAHTTLGGTSIQSLATWVSSYFAQFFTGASTYLLAITGSTRRSHPSSSFFSTEACACRVTHILHPTTAPHPCASSSTLSVSLSGAMSSNLPNYSLSLASVISPDPLCSSIINTFLSAHHLTVSVCGPI